ncbi:putative Zn-dependent protease [Methylohalomonas lacus]|uniref:Zn-dependent protease n=1 Tax=Methylohalomonas lacus TaxID=398773 RepID=A0AAE3L509_9GAMM|nr:TldD/PmbA family protein [Methylohalomonas lacus]MCS3902487.1 putative Zn-dependent protease [Methylohalomonas lacus]
MTESLTDIVRRFRRQAPAGCDWSLRLVDETEEHLLVRRHVAEPPLRALSRGACISVNVAGSCAYAASADLSNAGLLRAFEQARQLAEQLKPLQLYPRTDSIAPDGSGDYVSPVQRPWSSWSLAEKYDYLRLLNEQLASDAAIVDWAAGLGYRRAEVLIAGAEHQVRQQFEFISPALGAVANRADDTQTRSYGDDRPAQAGLEHLEAIGFQAAAERTAQQALELLRAEECPDRQCDVLLMPGQMMLQIHESIGHPLELDRILGDERNYAGTSFVTADMFGQYQYGSSLLNVVFEPDVPGELASYAFDDNGSPAERQYLIRNGLLLRALGGTESQQRAGLPGVANARTSSWNRPPIDRMANINIEPGDSSMTELIAGIEDGILMDTNRSWSIDDSRNKFQFGCEYARRIENGTLGAVIKNPNYRGISAQFWRNLKAVGNVDTWAAHGVHTCGKGEPNQALYSGHAAPACVFTDVAVFGGD